MSGRATYVAKVLIKRLNDLEIGFLDDAGSDKSYRGEVIRDMVSKVLASEMGVTDEISIRRALDGLPRVIPGEPPAQREFDEQVDFLRKQLAVA